ncbi:MAG: hypothetical protein ACRD96_06670 [Bryobacteraceae bacterium]
MQLTLPDVVAIVVCGAAAFTGVVWFVGRKGSPEDRERRRRLAVDRSGRMGDAMVTDVRENVLFYSYTVRGVSYTASQDVTALAGMLPSAPAQLVGPCGVKYTPHNPANSIVVCEQWSGLRVSHLTKKGD